MIKLDVGYPPRVVSSLDFEVDESLFDFAGGRELERTKSTQLQLEQQDFCRTHDAGYQVAEDFVNSGLALSTEELLPINGLRHPMTPDTTGWYIWCGEQFSEDDDFFKPVHTLHLYEKFPEIRKLLGLAPGWRFLVTGEYLDVWYDASLLKVS